MKKHSMDDKIVEELLEGKWKELLNIVLRDENLCMLFREEMADIYYRGHKCFSVDLDKITCNSSFTNDVKNYSVKENPSMEEFWKELPYYKQNIDFWFGTEKRPYEREFSQLIMRENNSAKLGRYTDYFVLDMEYQYENGDRKPEPDLIAVKMERSARQEKKKRKLAFIEVKYADEAYNNKAGIFDHIKDYVELLENQNLLNAIKDDFVKIYEQRKKLGMLQGIVGDWKNVVLNEERPELILALIGHNSNSGQADKGKDLKSILTNALDIYGVELLDSVYVAQVCEMGFGLLTDKMIKIADYVGYGKY